MDTNSDSSYTTTKPADLCIIDDALKDAKCNEVTRGFFRTVTEANRVRKIEAIIKGFNQIMTASRGEVLCMVTTATKPDQKVLDQIKTILGGFVRKDQKVVMDVKVNPGLIGGMVVEVGDRYCDMSVATKIRRLSESLNAAV
ncbi:ATP synthase subunit O, mitochondrial-like [Sycon ciliatum]|uniref:ATP synthase subunit O, mitochondrial-like n=1 Tax=Sycon ciliatum TaxID=27933 RepID=UPI0031F60B2B